MASPGYFWDNGLVCLNNWLRLWVGAWSSLLLQKKFCRFFHSEWFESLQHSFDPRSYQVGRRLWSPKPIWEISRFNKISHISAIWEYFLHVGFTRALGASSSSSFSFSSFRVTERALYERCFFLSLFSWEFFLFQIIPLRFPNLDQTLCFGPADRFFPNMT